MRCRLSCEVVPIDIMDQPPFSPVREVQKEHRLRMQYNKHDSVLTSNAGGSHTVQVKLVNWISDQEV